MVPSGTKIGKKQLNILAYADDIVLIGKKVNKSKITFCRNGKHCQKVRTTDKPQKIHVIVEKEKHFKRK
jgi:hypothetical protein